MMAARVRSVVVCMAAVVVHAQPALAQSTAQSGASGWDPRPSDYCFVGRNALELGADLGSLGAEKVWCEEEGHCTVPLVVFVQGGVCKVRLPVAVLTPGTTKRTERHVIWQLRPGEGVRDIEDYEFHSDRGVLINGNKDGEPNDRGSDFDNSRRGDVDHDAGRGRTSFLWTNRKSRERYLCFEVHVRPKRGREPCVSVDPLIANQ